MYADALQVQTSHLLVKMLGQAVNIDRILLVEQFYLSQGLVSETIAHYKTGMSRCAAQVNQSAVGQKDDAMTVGEEVTVYLRLYVLTLYAGYLLEFVHLDLAVKVADVADDSLIGHDLEMIGCDYVYVTCCGYEYIAEGCGLLHGDYLIAFHGSLQCADGVNLGYQYAGSVRAHALGTALTYLTVTCHNTYLTGNHDIGGALDTVGQ